jgi:hypothetical protein
MAENLKAEMTPTGTVKFTTPHGSVETGSPEETGVWVHWSFVYNPQSSDGMAMYRHGKKCDAATGSVETFAATPMPDFARLWIGNSPHIDQPEVEGSYVVVHNAVFGMHHARLVETNPVPCQMCRTSVYCIVCSCCLFIYISETNADLLLGLAFCALVLYGLAWLGLAWLGLAWLGLALLGLAWYGMAWHGMAWLGLT